MLEKCYLNKQETPKNSEVQLNIQGNYGRGGRKSQIDPLSSGIEGFLKFLLFLISLLLQNSFQQTHFNPFDLCIDEK